MWKPVQGVGAIILMLLLSNGYIDQFSTAPLLSRLLRMLKETMEICEEEKDYQTRELLQPLLYDTEEDHARWLERQLRVLHGALAAPGPVQAKHAEHDHRTGR